MANEHVLITEVELPVNFTCANSTGIEKGACLKLTDPMTAIINSGTDDTIAGICASEKIASNGVTQVSVYRRGFFKAKLSGSCTVGDPLGTITGYPNFVASQVATLNLSQSKTLGFAMETGVNGDTILYELNIGNGI